MLKSKIKYLVLSDLHLGHKRNSTVEMVNNLNIFFNHYKHRDDLDVIFLAGDVFDRLLDFTTDDMAEIMVWVSRLITFCGRCNIKLRVLEGTPSHDWMQSRVFDTIVKINQCPVDFKYVSALSIERIEDLGITVLYMPDEWNISTDRTFEQVVDLLAENHLAQVDIGIFHGMFAYQVPVAALKIPRHDEARYLAIVKYFINIGHVHTYSTYSRILAQGSFDRISHGEEGAKGAIEVVLQRDDESTFTFIENKGAKLFKTLVLRGKDVEAAVKQIERAMQTWSPGTHLRLKASKDHPALLAFDELKKKFPDLILSKTTLEEASEAKSSQLNDSLIDEAVPYQPITITADNLEMLLTAEIKPRYTFTDSQWEIYKRALKAIC